MKGQKLLKEVSYLKDEEGNFITDKAQIHNLFVEFLK